MADERELLRELLNRRPRTDDWFLKKNEPLNIAPEGLPQVPTAPMFRPGTQVVGDTRLQEATEALFKLAPELRGRVDIIQAAPTAGAMQTGWASKIQPHELPDTTLAGQWSMLDKSIYINPNKQRVDYGIPLESTLAHEMGHAVGHHHGPEMDQIEELAKTLIPQFIGRRSR